MRNKGGNVCGRGRSCKSRRSGAEEGCPSHWLPCAALLEMRATYKTLLAPFTAGPPAATKCYATHPGANADVVFDSRATK